jgi:hypothetical protein
MKAQDGHDAGAYEGEEAAMHFLTIIATRPK